MERRSVALNPRSALFSGDSALQFAIDHRLDKALAVSEQLLRDGPWAVYNVRRIYHPAIDKQTKQSIPTKKGTAWRSVETLAEGPRQHMVKELHRIAAARSAGTTTDRFAITRAPLITPTSNRFPAAAQFLSVGPAGVGDKRRKSFAGLWAQLVDQTTLFAA